MGDIKMEGVELTLSLAMFQEWTKFCSQEKLFHIDSSPGGRKHGLYEEKEKVSWSSSSSASTSVDEKQEDIASLQPSVPDHSKRKDDHLALPLSLINSELNYDHFSIYNNESQRKVEMERTR